jgi:hypothetical protein
VSKRDFEWLSQWTWYLGSNGYVCRKVRVEGKHRTILMHRLILGLDFGDPRMGEHEDRNPLNCQRSNLCIAARGNADNSQNQGLRTDNVSGYRGVHWHKPRRRWTAQARFDGKTHYLGLFDTPEEADAAVKACRAQRMPFSEDAR